MHELRSTADRVLSAILDDQPLTAAKVKFAWRIAAGPTLSAASTISWQGDGILRVAVRSSQWRQEVERARALILARLHRLLGANAVTRIQVDELA